LKILDYVEDNWRRV